MFVSKDAIKFYEQDIKYFYNEIYRSIANFLVEHYRKYGEVDTSQILNEISATEIKNKDEIISEISAISFRKDSTKFSKKKMEDCVSVINEERTKIYERNKFRQEFEGKSVEEQARLLKEYISKKN